MNGRSRRPKAEPVDVVVVGAGQRAWLSVTTCGRSVGNGERSVHHPGHELSGESGREKSTTSSGPVGTAESGSTLPQVSDGSLRYEARE